MTRLLVDELPPAQRLALAYAPARARRPTLALLALDARLGGIIRRRGEPMLRQVRLAWWREMLAAEPGTWPTGEALLELLREWRRPAALGALVDGWEALLGDKFDTAAIGEFAEGRTVGFAELARELGADPGPVAHSARLWALGDLAANLSNAGERAAVIERAAALPRPPLPRTLRPLTVLAGLAQRSLRHGGPGLLDGPGASLLAVRLGITGR